MTWAASSSAAMNVQLSKWPCDKINSCACVGESVSWRNSMKPRNSICKTIMFDVFLVFLHTDTSTWMHFKCSLYSSFRTVNATINSILLEIFHSLAFDRLVSCCWRLLTWGAPAFYYKQMFDVILIGDLALRNNHSIDNKTFATTASSLLFYLYLLLVVRFSSAPA